MNEKKTNKELKTTSETSSVLTVSNDSNNNFHLPTWQLYFSLRYLLIF